MRITLISVDETVSMLGLRDISSVLKNAGYDIGVLSMQGTLQNKIYSNKQLEILEGYINGSQLVGVSSMAVNKLKAKQVLAVAKKMGIVTVWGGIHPTLFPEECCKYSDFVCIGEGEDTILELAEAIRYSRNMNSIKNLAFIEKDIGNFVRNPVRPIIHDLDAQPYPDHDIYQQHILINDELLTISEYLKDINNRSGRNIYIYLYTSKGCPYSCTYCSNSKMNEVYSNTSAKVRFKSVKRIIEELKILKDIYYFMEKVWIMDDSFLNRSEKTIEEFKNEFIKHISKPLDFFATPNMVTYQKIKALLPIDISLIRIGIQSGSNNTLKNIYNRPIDTKYVLNAGNIIFEINKDYKTNINVVYQLIINNPYESESDLLETIKLIRKIQPPFYLSTFFLIFLPGSKLYERAISDGIVSTENDGSDEEFLAENYKNHLSKNSKNLYLNSVLFWMHGRASRFFIGCVPRVLLGFIIFKPIILLHTRLKKVVLFYNGRVHRKQKTLKEFLNALVKNNKRGLVED